MWKPEFTNLLKYFRYITLARIFHKPWILEMIPKFWAIAFVYID